MDKEDIMANLETSVVNGKKDEATNLAKIALESGIPALVTINDGLVKGMNIVGDRYAAHEIFLPHVLLAANAMYGALDILLPEIPKADADKMVHVCIGVAEGDVHDIGKNIVKTMLTAAGCSVNDLGRDVPIEDFVEAVKSDNAGVAAISTLMTPTMDSMKSVIDGMVEAGIRDGRLVMIGGPPTSPAFAKEIGADLHAINAQQAVIKLEEAL